MLGARFPCTQNTIAIGKFHDHNAPHCKTMNKNIKFVELDMGSTWADQWLVLFNRWIRFHNGDLQPMHDGVMTISSKIAGFHQGPMHAKYTRHPTPLKQTPRNHKWPPCSNASFLLPWLSAKHSSILWLFHTHWQQHYKGFHWSKFWHLAIDSAIAKIEATDPHKRLLLHWM